MQFSPVIVIIDGLWEKLSSVLGITIIGLILYQISFYFVKRWGRNNKRVLPNLLQQYIHFPGLMLIFLITLILGLTFLSKVLDPVVLKNIRHGLIVAIIVNSAVLATRVITLILELSLRRFQSEDPIDFSYRKARTKFELLQKVVNFIIILAAFSAVLMTFESVRRIGSTLLASAGVVGLVLGFAAQKSLGTLFAGIQIAISQPVRLDDVVVVEGQYGTIGEITLTYVVLHTWDGRRKIIPINYFLENSFENWTRKSPEMIGKCTIHTDYSLPLEELRGKVGEWVQASPLWDERRWGLNIISAGAKTIEIRAVMSTRNSGDAFDLETEIREKMIAWIQKNYPQCLPRERVELSRTPSTGEEAGG